jgi:hypothetical protein
MGKYIRVFHSCVLLFLLIGLSSSAYARARKEKSGHLVAERNSELSYLLSRLVLQQTAGDTDATGAYLVKIFDVSRGEECDVQGEMCEGFDLVISVTSLDILGDKALYQVKGLKNWKFAGWKTYADYDEPGYSTSFRVSVETRDGKPIRECGKPLPGKNQTILLSVNPWKISCEYSD